MSQQQFNEFVEAFIRSQETVNTQLAKILHQQNTQTQTVTEGVTYIYKPQYTKGLLKDAVL
ncbi:12152_t:CDS:2 [Dentiscutata heterogama]|uniref:12152_t:CDS:1 n=1 Tax=Dentiscutata heterogama TaxID=1316150 RepID=A0ACA9K3T8_9GLOM|nr:12152_t:CDS:2 [Dentiscutata heterogama]